MPLLPAPLGEGVAGRRSRSFRRAWLLREGEEGPPPRRATGGPLSGCGVGVGRRPKKRVPTLACGRAVLPYWGRGGNQAPASPAFRGEAGILGLFAGRRREVRRPCLGAMVCWRPKQFLKECRERSGGILRRVDLGHSPSWLSTNETPPVPYRAGGKAVGMQGGP